MKKVFLGGTRAESVWREKLIHMLQVNYFNPVVECMTDEQREMCDFYLYVITPSMQDFYAIAEAVDDSKKRPGKTIFCFLDKDIPRCEHIYEELKEFNKAQIKQLEQVAELVLRNGGKCFRTLTEVAAYLNRT